MWLVCLIVLQALTVQFQISLCSGCLEQERTALLQIKASMSDYPWSKRRPSFFESWDSAGYYEGGGSSDCCSWEGVECNITTAKVIKLDLSYASGGWPLNASLFVPFEDLTHLDLSANYFSSWIPNHGLGRLSALPNLQTLILDCNSFDETILPSFGELSSLRILSLYENLFKGTFDFGEFHNMTSLYELNLESNYIYAIKGLRRLHALDKLEVLNLGDNHLNNSILPSLGLHSTLKALSLDNNQFTGEFDVRELSNMSNLEELDLSGNNIIDVKGLESLSKLTILSLPRMELNKSGSILQSVSSLRSLKALDMSSNNLRGFDFANGSFGFSNLLELVLHGNGLGLDGMIPSWLGNFTSLRYLDLSYNQFQGNFALSPIADLNTLECLIVTDNNLDIPISLTTFFNHSKLKVLETDNNKILVSDKVEEFHEPKFQLKLLSFSNCWSNNPITRLPDFFYYQSDLRIVDLSQINLALPFPGWLLENNTLLERCNMRNNSLTGSFQFRTHHLCTRTTEIDISENRLESQVLENIGRIFPVLVKLCVSGNQFGGRLPTSMGELKYLEILDLSNSNLSEEILNILVNDCPSLRLLRLSHNNLSGQLSPSLYNLTGLEYLYLDDNHFVGEIPDSFPAFSLRGLDLSNHFSGKLPRWIGNLSFNSIAMASNHLEGSIPIEFCKLGESLYFLDLSDNHLSGSIPSCFSPPQITHVHLNRNK